MDLVNTQVTQTPETTATQLKSPTPSPSPTPTPEPEPTVVPLTRLLFTGVIVPARCVQARIDELNNPDYPYEEVKDIIQDADLAIGTLNATISDTAPRTGCVRTYVLVGGAENASALARAGFDMMSTATNHIKNCGPANCGDQAFYETMDNLDQAGILTVGAGNNHAEALRPVVVEINGTRFGFVSLGQIEPRAFAGESAPGIAILNEENIKQSIAAAKDISDVVIFMPHWGPEDVSIPNWIQRNLAEEIVAAGADLVVGNHTHVVQAIQEISGIPVFYGLGNFVFDQDLTDHQQGVILMVTFQGTEILGYELIPTHVDEDGRVHLADPEESAEILERIETASQAIK
jgi:poly-gamma-glutamate synthesis protein (capsule biosynthesis protein)